MKRPLLAALVVSLVCAPLLAGCIGSAQATAMENRASADDAARAWDAEAKLAQVVGVEGSADLVRFVASMMESGASASAQEFDRAAEDEDVGDGKAEVWLYRYLAPSKTKSLVVILDGDGGVLRQSEERRETGEATLGAYELDSDRALEIAMGASEGLRKGVASEKFGIVSLLAQEPGAPRAFWLVAGGGGSLAGGGGGFVKIDAVSGEVLMSQGGFGSPEDYARAWG